VSCEKLFRPDLEGKPVVVLSSNDGCAVARSNEAKALGIPMAAPAFKYRDIFERHKVVKFSGNFELYGDVSRRITDLLTTITPRIEIYSVDESFLDLSQLIIEDYDEWGRMVCERVQQWIGVPVSIGIAPTKTLAKIATERAKKLPELRGALSLVGKPPSEVEKHLNGVQIKDVWGVGWRLAPKLRGEGVATALDLRRLRPRRAQQLMGIHGRQMVAELNGTSCYPLQREGKPRQSIARTRTFGEDTNDQRAIEAALASFVSKAAYRLRESGQVARRIGVFVQTNKHKPGFRSWNQATYFAIPSADTGRLIGAALELFGSFYNPALEYHRAGVYLWDFLPVDALQTDIFGNVDVGAETRSTTRMQTMDSINERYGRGTLHYAAEDLGNAWEPKHRLRSPRYVSRWEELPVVRTA
jgi:DNA polymerase V